MSKLVEDLRDLEETYGYLEKEDDEPFLLRAAADRIEALEDALREMVHLDHRPSRKALWERLEGSA